MIENIACTCDLNTKETTVTYFHEAKREWIEEKINFAIMKLIVHEEKDSPDQSAEDIVARAKEKHKQSALRVDATDAIMDKNRQEVVEL